jgi:hypothetical protein
MITTIVLVFYSPTSQVVNHLAHLLHLFVTNRRFKVVQRYLTGATPTEEICF